MMIYIENIAAFCCGLFLTLALVWLAKRKLKPILFVLSNSLVGAFLYLAQILISDLKPITFDSFLTGALGIVGALFSLF
ncbi:MAG: hypothetical protein LBT20_08395 [Clostridiales bacterium]|jgi:H+/gluconate symporter-like permease|nr:hypothetical protein [Clostridiales bacterium]